MKPKKTEKPRRARKEGNVCAGRIFREVRVDVLGYDQETAGRRLKVKRSAIGAWENGDNEIPPDKLFQMGIEVVPRDPEKARELWSLAGINIEHVRLALAELSKNDSSVPLLEEKRSISSFHDLSPEVSPMTIEERAISLPPALTPLTKAADAFCVRVGTYRSSWPFGEGDLVGVTRKQFPELGIPQFLDHLVAVQYSSIPAYGLGPYDPLSADKGQERGDLVARWIKSWRDRSELWLKWTGLCVGWLCVERAPQSSLWRVVVKTPNLSDLHSGQVLPLSDWRKERFDMSVSGQLETAITEHAAELGVEPSRVLGRVVWWISSVKDQ